jgi:uncharacterized membrane protein
VNDDEKARLMLSMGSMVMLGQAMVSPWITLPMCGVVMVLLAGYGIALSGRVDVPSSRRRLRIASTVLQMFLVGFITIGVSMVSPSVDPKVFVLVWIVIVGVLAGVIVLAVMDMVNNFRLAASERRRVIDEQAQALARSLGAREGRRGQAEGGLGAGHDEGGSGA